MLSLAGASRDLLRHVIRAPEVYLVPRSDGRILVGSDASKKRDTTSAPTQTRFSACTRRRCIWFPLWPRLACWKRGQDCGPGSPDDLPILGATRTPGYFVATGHFRDGILLTPVTAHVMAQMVTGGKPEYDLSAFSPARFQN